MVDDEWSFSSDSLLPWLDPLVLDGDEPPEESCEVLVRLVLCDAFLRDFLLCRASSASESLLSWFESLVLGGDELPFEGLSVIVA